MLFVINSDDVVICSLQPTNDYKTSVLSGLSPSLILEICSRAISFWTYQIHQEATFQAELLRNANEKNATFAKDLHNVIAEANSQLSLLNDKCSQLERDLELERRKMRDKDERMKEKDKEYQRLKNQYDGLKRKALLAPNGAILNTNPPVIEVAEATDNAAITRVRALGNTAHNIGGMTMGEIAHGMDANRIQRTPLRPGAGMQNQQSITSWPQQPQQLHQPRPQLLVQGRSVAPVNVIEEFRGRASQGSGGRTPGSDEIQILDEIPPPIIQPFNQATSRQAVSRQSRQMHANNGPGFFGQSSTMDSRFPPQQPTVAVIPTGATSRRVYSAVANPTAVRRPSGGFRPASFVPHGTSM
ncbi:hypothetical protein FRB90_011918 [Tulasnella sp. 427]|nr:hypothetical protein FRB90_011918 [Tulasnella sp. 427]